MTAQVSCWRNYIALVLVDEHYEIKYSFKGIDLYLRATSPF